ncbi:hypothetical protein C8R45DRAFT_1113723 [Mycena sanguinolenta]|nr:hypothetical protein C8R45DRAFT_1113723 [Mycena sanguinolenta]
MGTSYRKKPTSKRSLGQREQLTKAQAARHNPEPHISPASQPKKHKLQKDLKKTRQILSDTQERLENTEKRLALTTNRLSQTESTLTILRRNYATLSKRNSDLYRLLRTECRKIQRYAETKLALGTELKEQSSLLHIAEEDRDAALASRDLVTESENRMRELLNQSDAETARLKSLLHNSRQKIRAIQMQNLRSCHSRDSARAKAQQALEVSKVKTRWNVRKGGTYTADARAMARALVRAGCSQEKVGEMIQYVGRMAGRSVHQRMSRRTVQRALIEGGVAARIQLAHEMSQADGVALSTDATTVRGENHESGFVMINKGTSHKMRIFSMTSTVSHSSEAQLANIKFQIAAISTLYKQSPLAR